MKVETEHATVNLAFVIHTSGSFAEQEIDGEATAAAFATCAGPDCLKDVIPKLGIRLKVYNTLKLVIDQGKGFFSNKATVKELTYVFFFL